MHILLVRRLSVHQLLQNSAPILNKDVAAVCIDEPRSGRATNGGYSGSSSGSFFELASDSGSFWSLDYVTDAPGAAGNASLDVSGRRFLSGSVTASGAVASEADPQWVIDIFNHRWFIFAGSVAVGLLSLFWLLRRPTLELVPTAMLVVRTAIIITMRAH